MLLLLLSRENALSWEQAVRQFGMFTIDQEDCLVWIPCPPALWLAVGRKSMTTVTGAIAVRDRERLLQTKWHGLSRPAALRKQVPLPTWCSRTSWIITVGFVLKVAGGPQEKQLHRKICENKARVKPLQASDWLDFSSGFWLFLTLRGEWLFSTTLVDLFGCARTQCAEDIHTKQVGRKMLI